MIAILRSLHSVGSAAKSLFCHSGISNQRFNQSVLPERAQKIAINDEGGSKGGISRPAKMRKPQCTGVHEDFRIKYNAESTLLTHPPVVVG